MERIFVRLGSDKMSLKTLASALFQSLPSSVVEANA
jgi:hypothetical protein